MAKNKSALRLVLLWIGAIISVIGNVAGELGYASGSIATVVGIVAALIGCYLWTSDKNRAWGFALLGTARSDWLSGYHVPERQDCETSVA
jgi:O-antigen/teichoic acid export membrane protein